MGATNWITLLLTHPNEFRTLLQFWLYHEQKRDITSMKEHPTSGWDRSSMRRCWEFLDMTSRSFAAVIKELDGDLARVVCLGLLGVFLAVLNTFIYQICLFYLVLRGLDTIEDDMTIPDEKKQPILRSFHELTVKPGWTFNECGPDEKDRQLLVEYDKVVEELNHLSPEYVSSPVSVAKELINLCRYRNVILSITRKMALGMADFAHRAATAPNSKPLYLSTIAEYDLYCHYVAGLVGEGLSGLFSASKKEASWLADQLELSNSLGLLLQKTNIIRDYREDVDQGRYFWPKEIWGQEKYGFKDMKDMYAPDAKERAQWVQSEMVLDAMRHLVDGLDYLRLLKNQSVFVFCAIPASMAIATLELCFMNPDMFQRNIKIRKAAAADVSTSCCTPVEF
jgi:farnesyl-diphosphate farnesyltransferase